MAVTIFKNDVLYSVQEAMVGKIYKITVPENIEDTEKAYIDYAMPRVM